MQNESDFIKLTAKCPGFGTGKLYEENEVIEITTNYVNELFVVDKNKKGKNNG